MKKIILVSSHFCNCSLPNFSQRFEHKVNLDLQLHELFLKILLRTFWTKIYEFMKSLTQRSVSHIDFQLCRACFTFSVDLFSTFNTIYPVLFSLSFVITS